MEENIYRAPKAEVSVELNYSIYDMASTGKRFSNMVLDFVFYLAFSFLVGLAFLWTGVSEQLAAINDNVLGIILITLYYFPQEAIWGRTLGKLITKTKVVALDGSKPSIMQALGRTLCRFVPFEAFTFLGGKGKPHGLHDKIPKTKVISLDHKRDATEGGASSAGAKPHEIVQLGDGEFRIGGRTFNSRKDAEDYLALLNGME